MELYTLDGLLRRTELIEGYESYIWTERYSSVGEVKVVTPSTQQFRNLLASGTFISLSESQRVMKVETIEDTEGEDGSKHLTISGIEISKVLYDRVARTGFVGEKPGTWKASGKPSDVIRALFDYVCRNGSSNLTDKLQLLVAGSLYSAGNIPEDTDAYTIEREIGPLYDAMKEVADVWDLGLRLYKGLDTGTLYFDVYKGNDRTTNQQILPAVIFSPDLDTLQGVSELTSVANSKNVAEVVSDYMTVTVYADGASETTAGFDKRVLFVKANDIQYPPRTNTLTVTQEQAINRGVALPTTLEDEKLALGRLIRKERLLVGDFEHIGNVATRGGLLAEDRTHLETARSESTALEAAETVAMTALLTQRGIEELAKNRSISAFDGEITQLSPYKYNRDYSMGDLVEMRNSTGLTNQMLVTEQIFAADETGERAYPTLTIKRFITPGSWLAWENSQVWQDAPGVWADA